MRGVSNEGKREQGSEGERGEETLFSLLKTTKEERRS